FLGREERIENALGVLDALAVVAELGLQPASLLRGFNLDHATAPRGPNRIVSVVEDIEKDLLQLVRIADELGQALIELLHDFNSVIGEVVCAQSDGLVENVIDLQGVALRRPLPGKAQEVLYDYFRSLRLLQDDLQVFAGAAGDLRIFH